jgi:hypothetical protein
MAEVRCVDDGETNYQRLRLYKVRWDRCFLSN